MKADLWPDFVAFAKAQIATWDIDPVYPVLVKNFDIEGLTLEQRYWRLALYLTFYHLGSAEYWWTQEPEPSLNAVVRITASPTGVERRGMRGNTTLVQRFLHDMLQENMQGSVAVCWNMGGKEGWKFAFDTIQQACRGAGTWAAYKWADLLKNVLGLPITANDLGLGGGGKNAGPIPGLSKLTGCPWEECANDLMLQEVAYQKALDLGVPFTGLDQFETCLCDFNSLVKGHYYVGADIDAMQAHLSPSSYLWVARELALPRPLLGEVAGWTGVAPAMLKTYAQTGAIISRIGRFN